MKKQIMKIKDYYIDQIEKGIKKHEYRLAEPERLSLKIGDLIILRSINDKYRYVEVQIKDINIFKTWEEALSQTWQEDFAGMYNSIDELLNDVNKFYTRDEVREYGIIVYTIEKVNKEIKKAKVLLDTNIFIQRESYNNVSTEVINLYKWFDSLSIIKCLHPSTIEEISKHSNETIKKNLLLKSKSYFEIAPSNNVDKFFDETVSKYSINENDKIDDKLLLQAYELTVDYLITNDKKMLDKAKELYIDQYVLSPQQFLAKVEKLYPSLINYDVLSVELVSIGELDINDEFFDSLREDYDCIKFNNWLRKKAYEKAYVFKEKDKLQGFLYLKTEEFKDEDYSNIIPKFDDKRRLKIGTFKISKSGLRLGERFLKIIFDNAIVRNVDEIYVTMFENKRDEVIALKELMLKWGFKQYGYKISDIGKEIVLIKNMRDYDYAQNPMYNYPLIKQKIDNYGFLPIYSDYHTKLFPDLYLKNEDMSIYTDNACGYAIEKIYVCNSKPGSLKAGDLLFVYRMGDRYPKAYHSVITGLAIFEEMLFPLTKDKYLNICKNKTVFTEEELSNFYDDKNYRTIIKVLFYKAFNKKIILSDLWDNNIIESPNGPRMNTIIDERKFNVLYNLDKEIEK